MQRQQVRDEHISTPCRHHVSVEQRGQRAPEHGSVLDCLDPEEKGKDQQEDSNSLVIVTSCDRTRNVTGCDAHEGCGEKTGGRGSNHLVGQKISRERGEAGEGRGEEYADVTNVDGESQEAEGVVDDAAGYHQSGVESATGDSSERMPCSYSSHCVSCYVLKAMRSRGEGRRRSIRSSNQSQKL
jgi:hypothetical protein